MTRVEKLLNDTKEALTKAINDLAKNLDTKVAEVATRVNGAVEVLNGRLATTSERLDGCRATLDDIASKWSLVVKLEGRVADLEKKAEQRTEAA